VAELAVAGKKDDAKKLIETGSYKEISLNLTTAMGAWKSSLPK
jgi:hypothetical protein